MNKQKEINLNKKNLDLREKSRKKYFTDQTVKLFFQSRLYKTPTSYENIVTVLSMWGLVIRIFKNISRRLWSKSFNCEGVQLGKIPPW